MATKPSSAKKPTTSSKKTTPDYIKLAAESKPRPAVATPYKRKGHYTP